MVFIRQSTPSQVEHDRESTARQYALADRACQLGWSREQVVIIDEDLGLSGSSTDKRSGFTRLTSEVALAQVGIVLGLEVSRLARNNADWYRLLELCGVTDTLIGDNDGVYHPALFNDRLLLGLKGTMSEAELHIIRARLDGGIRNKAARGELRRGLPVGFVWGEDDGEVLFHPDQAVTRRDPHGLRALRRIRFRASRLAVVSFRRLVLSTARRAARTDSLGSPHLPCTPPHSDQSGVCWRLHLW
jgi:DNA invertase Pin-like site-specific DNA recombinase